MDFPKAFRLVKGDVKGFHGESVVDRETRQGRSRRDQIRSDGGVLFAERRRDRSAVRPLGTAAMREEAWKLMARNMYPVSISREACGEFCVRIDICFYIDAWDRVDESFALDIGAKIFECETLHELGCKNTSTERIRRWALPIFRIVTIRFRLELI
jgi:hypothetical protein